MEAESFQSGGDWPLVAIATPVYNGARFLAETMACVQAQSYPNIVHCVLDNASTDATPEIIARFASGRVPLIVGRNARTLPMLDNWNAVLHLVPREAAYFRILPADDLILSLGIEKMVAMGERHPEANIIGCQEWANETLLGTDLPHDRTLFDGRAIVRGSLMKAIRGFPHFHCLYRKPPGDMPDAFYDTECYGTRLLPIDVDAAMRVLCGGPYACVHEPLVITRLHSDSVTSRETLPNHLKVWSELQLIDRWGPHAFDKEEDYLRCRARHLRFYYRHLLLWRARRQFALLDQHLEWLGRASARPTAQDYVRAAAEWPLLRLSRTSQRLAVRLGLLSASYQIVQEVGPFG